MNDISPTAYWKRQRKSASSWKRERTSFVAEIQRLRALVQHQARRLTQAANKERHWKSKEAKRIELERSLTRDAIKQIYRMGAASPSSRGATNARSDTKTTLLGKYWK